MKQGKTPCAHNATCLLCVFFLELHTAVHILCCFVQRKKTNLKNIHDRRRMLSHASLRAGLVSFGIRGDSFVVGDITADEVLDDQNPFQNLISGAGWLVRAGVNHVEASARDGHLDILLDAKDGVRGSDGATVDDEDDDDDGGDDDGATAVGGGGDAGRLDDVLVAKLARTAIGHDAEGRLILLQVRAEWR